MCSSTNLASIKNTRIWFSAVGQTRQDGTVLNLYFQLGAWFKIYVTILVFFCGCHNLHYFRFYHNDFFLCYVPPPPIFVHCEINNIHLTNMYWWHVLYVISTVYIAHTQKLYKMGPECKQIFKASYGNWRTETSDKNINKYKKKWNTEHLFISRSRRCAITPLACLYFNWVASAQGVCLWDLLEQCWEDCLIISLQAICLLSTPSFPSCGEGRIWAPSVFIPGLEMQVCLEFAVNRSWPFYESEMHGIQKISRYSRRPLS